jgi:hypothetical protein
MSHILRFGFLQSLLLVSANRIGADALSAGGLTLELDARANVIGMKVGQTKLRLTPRPLAQLCEVEKGTFAAPRVKGGQLENGIPLEFGEARVRGTLTAKTRDNILKFSCVLKGGDLPARGMLLRFAFPFDAMGWRWHSDMQTAVPIDRGNVYENVRPLRAYADLPEWKDQPDLRMGYSNRNFCTVVAGPVGLCLAVPIDKPCIFRTAYDAKTGQLQIVYDFALSPDTRKPNEVEFAFDLYACDPKWGFRSALSHYYQAYPALFRNYIKEPGQWMAFSRLSEIDNVNEFYFALQEGAPEPEYDDRIGVSSAVYFTHAGMGARIPNHDPEKDPLPAHDVQVKAMEEAFKRRTQVDGMYNKVGLHGTDGKLDVRKWRVYAHLIAQFNLDPEQPYGAWTLEAATARTERVRKTRKARLDGFYYDGLSAGINYRKDHFKTADAPCLWDPVARKPFINNFFSSCEFARAAAEFLRPQGQFTMMNGALGASFYVAPWLDVLGAETGLRIPRESFNYIRSTTYHKPFLTLLKGNYEQRIGNAEMELYMKRCLAYGVFPGFFDWPPSGLGPGGRYWDHARYFERDRSLFRKYQPLCRALSLAGWEPVTQARSSAPQVFIERFGPTADGIVWVTLLNEGGHPHRTQLKIDAKALGLSLATTEAVDVVEGASVELATQNDLLTADLDLPADGVMAIQLATPEAAANWRVRQALETLERSSLMGEIDKDRPPRLVHWVPKGGHYLREAVDGKNTLVFRGAGKGAQSASQWAMFFQPKATPIKLHVRASGDKLAGGKGAIGIRCRLAWVTASYSHYETRFFELPAGTYAFRDFEFNIESEHALRAISVTPAMGGGVKGTLKLAKVSLADADREEYVVDPDFQEWYEPIPEHVRGRTGKDWQVLRSLLLSLEKDAAKSTSAATREVLAQATGVCGSLQEFIVEERAQNGCRRLLRDLETIERHLGFVTLAAFDIAPPRIMGPVVAAPGDAVRLTFAPPTVPGLSTRTALHSDDVSIERSPGGGIATVPADAETGSTITIAGRLEIGPPGKAVSVGTRHQITVLPPIELRLESQGTDLETGACRVRAVVRNNRTRPVTARLDVTAPERWKGPGPLSLPVPASGEATAEVELTPSVTAPAGSVEVIVIAVSGQDRGHSRATLLYIPRETNLIKNPGFEQGMKGWNANEGKPTVSAERRSGKNSVCLRNPVRLRTGVSQSVRLDQQTPCAILVRASSKAVDVSGKPGRDYSLYVDIYYKDGTPLYGRTYNFQTGTTDWQSGELFIEPAKPIRNVNVYLLLRGKAGIAYFDDVAVMEDPRRKGNVAREALVTVDSSYTRYDPTPINDGIIQGEGLHWTKEAWASAENATGHFIVLEFEKPRPISRATIYWSLDAGIPRTSQEVRLQIAAGDGWKTLAAAEPKTTAPQTTIRLRQPVTANRFRVFQPAGKGPTGRQGLMWVREVELFSSR